MKKEDLGNLIKDIRIKNNLTQVEFARMFYVSPQAISKWEKGLNMPDIEILYSIAEKFDYDFDKMIKCYVPSYKGKKENNFKITMFIICGIIIISVCLLVIFQNKDDFTFRTLSTNNNSFSIYGSVAYNDNKTTIYISNISYEEVDKDNLYKEIKCTLYENENDTKKIIDSYNHQGEEISLNDFLKQVHFNINWPASSCKMYEDNVLHLEIEAINQNHQTLFYKIPLILEDTCENEIQP